MKEFVFVFILFFGATSFSQGIDSTNFVLDPSKPYVYLKFDHIGPRKPHQDGEDRTGLWLKVVNNCRIPIILRASGGIPGEPGIQVEDEIIEVDPYLQIFTDKDAEDYKRNEEFRKEKLKLKPEGYSFEVSGVVTLQPGKEILTSFPLNHIDDFWYLRIKFALDLDKSSAAIGPFTYLSFGKWGLPQGEKTSKASPPQLNDRKAITP
jgi:hypothetical protein